MSALLTWRRDVIPMVLVCCALLYGRAQLPEARADAPIPFTDAHTHMLAAANGRGVESAVPEALQFMERHGAVLVIVSPPPSPGPRDGAYGTRELQVLVRAHPGRFAFTAGGDNLNPMIQQRAPDKVTPDRLRRFQDAAEAIAQAGAAGFGEIAAEHFAIFEARSGTVSTRTAKSPAAIPTSRCPQITLCL
jgi:hypothetical protein